MEVSTTFSFNAGCYPRISASGAYIAYVFGDRLVVRNSVSLATKLIENLSPEFAREVCLIEWDYSLPDSPEQRLAIASRDEVRTYTVGSTDDLTKAGAVILPGKHEIANVQWMSCQSSKTEDPTPGEIVRLAIFSRYGITVSIWTSDGMLIELASPKFGRAAKTGPSTFAFVTRPETTDIVRFFQLSGNKQRKIALKGTLDAKLVKWAPSGLWFAVSDNPALGYSVQLWACDGTSIHTYEGPDPDNHLLVGRLGVTSMEWVLLHVDGREKECLLAGDYDEHIAILDLVTFQPLTVLYHGTIYEDCCVWEEYLSDQSRKFEYRLMVLPVYFRDRDRQGIVIEVAPNGKFLATRVESTTTTVWIWSIEDVTDACLLAVLYHMSPVRKVQWNSTSTALLVVPLDNKIIGVWNMNSRQPEIIDWDNEIDGFDGWIVGAAWVSSTAILAWSERSFSIVTIPANYHEETELPMDSEDRIELQRQGSPQLLQDDDTHVRDLANGIQQSEWGQDPSEIQLEDTFHKFTI
jgi:WD40 repeat protein